jgi:hypothetical protein
MNEPGGHHTKSMVAPPGNSIVRTGDGGGIHALRADSHTDGTTRQSATAATHANAAKTAFRFQCRRRMARAIAAASA